MSWTAVVDRYLESLRSRRYSPATLRIEAQWLTRLTAHCQALQVPNVGSADREHLALFHQALLWRSGATGNRYSPRTVDQALRVVRSFFRWTVDAQLVLVDPTRGWVLPRVPKTVPILLTVKDVNLLLDVPDLRRPGGLRDRAVLETLYATGIRRAECHNLDIHDVELATQTLRVRAGKGAKDRWLPMGDALTATITRYLADGRPRVTTAAHQTALFLDRYGQRLSLQRYNQVVRSLGQQVGLKVTPHLLRHAYATHMMERGAELLYIQQLLGHDHLQSTQLYTHMCPLEVKRAHRQTHPRARRDKAPE